MTQALSQVSASGETLKKSQGNADNVSRPTEELVIGLVGAVGAGVSTAANILKRILEDEYDYEVKIIKASEIIFDNISKSSKLSVSSDPSDRIRDLQQVGSDLRAQFGENYIAAKCIEAIGVQRKMDGGFTEVSKIPQPKPLRKVTIIDSLKHPDESSLFKETYGKVYWQFTIFAPEGIRDQRLQNIGAQKSKLSGIFTTDENDPNDHGQKVSNTAFKSDFFIRNDHENDIPLTQSINRFLEILFKISVNTPTKDESGMYAAVSSASKSACLSRQVGAAIYSKDDELISVGWNDVPRFNGGLYTVENGEDDHRCYKWGGKICHNDQKKDILYDEIFNKLLAGEVLKANSSIADVKKILKKTPIKGLIEYSRSIHAEMEAIVSAARLGKSGMMGGTLYTTTFPCHNCARHIVAAGIKKVFYIEPYSKSLALNLHSDSISVLSSDDKKVTFLQYEGVGPSSIIKLFQHGEERKEDGAVRKLDKKTSAPVLSPSIDGFTTHEKRVIEQLAEIESDSRT